VGTPRRDRHFLEKGLDAIKEDSKRRFNLVLGIATSNGVGRTGGARAPQAAAGIDADRPLSRAAAKACLDLSNRSRSTIARTRSRTGRGPTSRDADVAQAAAPCARRRAHGRALASPRRWSSATDLAARAGAARSRPRGPGRVDEAARDLEIAVNLAPSNRVAWRMLGKILAQHGGALEAERADEALRNALTLEPGWTDLRELRDKLARRRAAGTTQRAGRARPSRRTSRAASTSRPRNGFASAIPSAWAASCSIRRWPTRPVSSRPRSARTRCRASCRPRRWRR
jgi:tetratricopeptide (TPR) repeat protein